MARPAAMTYNPETGKWSPSTTPKSSDSGSDSGSKSSNSGGSSSSSKKSSSAPKQTSTPTSGGESNLKASDTDKDKSAGATDKEYNTIEYNTLEGDLNFIVTAETIQLKAGDTVKLEGLGKYLSGNYYVVSISRSVGNDGYSHSAKVIRTDFGDKLKSGSSSESKDGGDSNDQGETEKTSSSSNAGTTTPKKTYTVKKGDCLWNIAKQEYGSGKSWKKIYDANTGQVVNPNLIYPGQKLVIP